MPYYLIFLALSLRLPLLDRKFKLDAHQGCKQLQGLF